MYFPRAFSPPLSDPAGAGGRGRTRSHHERDSLSAAAVIAAAGVPHDDPGHHNDDDNSNNNDGDSIYSSSRRPCKSDSDIALSWKEGERKQTTADIFPPTLGEGHDRTRQPPAYPGIDPPAAAAAFDSGPGMEDEMDVDNVYARREGGGGDSFLGFGFDDPLEELGGESSGVRGRTRSTSFQETDELDLEGEGAEAAGGGEGGVGSCCDLGWGDAADFGEGDMAERGRGRGEEDEEEEEEGGDADDLGSR